MPRLLEGVEEKQTQPCNRYLQLFHLRTSNSVCIGKDDVLIGGTASLNDLSQHNVRLNL